MLWACNAAVDASGEGWRCEEGWTRRWMGAFAIVVEGPALPLRGCSGVLAPVGVEVFSGSRLFMELLRRDGSCGSGWMEPSLCRSRILRSRRLI